MSEVEREPEQAREAEVRLRLHDPRVMDRAGRLVDLADVPEADLGQIVRVMDALFRWREAERRVSEASRRYMRLGETDMRALRFIIVRTDDGDHVTARDLATHLGITSAATTKLLDRLETAGHIRRTRHPSDRRALAILIDPETRAAAEATIGREHARRFRIAAGLTPAEREVVIGFLESLGATTEREWDEEPPSPGERPGAGT